MISFRHSILIIIAEALRQWPDGDYSIPMSIYGCPDQAINKWKHGSINMTFTYPITFNETTYRPIGETDQVSISYAFAYNPRLIVYVVNAALIFTYKHNRLLTGVFPTTGICQLQSF